MKTGILPTISPIRRWLFTTNHKDVGTLYLITSIYFLLIGGMLALLMRVQLLSAEMNFLGPVEYNQAFTVHGLIMILWFASPFALGFANYIVPLEIGARDLAFPRLNAMSYWMYLFSGLMMILTFFIGGAPDVGWTFYAPLTSSSFSPSFGLNLGAAALMTLIASVTLGSVNFIVTIIKLRAPGMKFKHLPIFSWSILITVFMMLYAFPSLLSGLLMLFSDRALGTMFFSSSEGGALLWDNLFWFFAHPEVYVIMFPAIGILGTILPTFSRRPLYGSKYIVMSMIIASIISFLVWGHHMFLTGINPLVPKLFSLTTLAVSLPFDVITIAMIETLVRSKIRLKTPVLFAIGAIALFVIGGITAVFLASVTLDHHLRGGYWVVAHFHYVMVGGAVFALIGGLYYWFPKITGHMFNETIGKLHFLISFIGFNLLYFPMFFLLDMPRRIDTYTVETGWAGLNTLASIGGFIFGLAQLLLLANLIRSTKVGKSAGPNPWSAWTLEWSTSSPPPSYNFDTTPHVSEKGSLQIQKSDKLGLNQNVTNQSSLTEEKGISYWPILMSLALFTIMLGLSTNFLILFVGVPFGIVVLYGYGREQFTVYEPKSTEGWPFGSIGKQKLGVWTFLASEIILFSVFIGAYFVVRFNSTSWPQVGEIFSIIHGATNTVILLTSSFTAVLALEYAKSGSRKGLLVSLLATVALGSTFIFNKAMEWTELFNHGFTFTSGLPGTSYFVITGVHALHVLAGLVILFFLIGKALKGKYLKKDYHAIEDFGLYWHFVDIIWIFIFPLFYLI